MNMDWNLLYDFQKSFRSARAISGASLLRRLNLPPNSLQYLYSNKIQPSKKSGSIGLELRLALEQLMKSSELQDSLADDSTLSEKVNDVLLSEDNKTKLDNAQILDVVVTDEDSNSVNVMCTEKYDEAKVQQTLGELTSAFPLHIVSYETAHQLGYYEPPMCVSSNAKGALFGTGCVVHNEGGIFGLTAKHVLLGLAEDEESPRPLTVGEDTRVFDVLARQSSTKCSISGRYHEGDTRVEKIGWFSRVDLHQEEDLASFHVSVEHGFAVNKFFSDRSISLSRNLLERTVLKVGATVCKVGVASGTTFGKIVHASAGKPLFWVSSKEIGLFATPGDSGALVVTEDNIAVGMVIKGTLKHTICLNICYLIGIKSQNDGQ